MYLPSAHTAHEATLYLNMQIKKSFIRDLQANYSSYFRQDATKFAHQNWSLFF